MMKWVYLTFFILLTHPVFAANDYVEGTTFDGKIVRAYYDRPEDKQAAQYVVDGALKSYKAHVGDWGFHTDDPDILEYKISDIEGASTDPVSDLKILISNDMPGDAGKRNVNFTTPEKIYETTVNHESNHHFVLSYVDIFGSQEWANWGWLYNGYAGVMDLVYEPTEQFMLNSPFYKNSGANAYVSNTNIGMVQRGNHDNNLFFGYLYAHNGERKIFFEIFERRKAKGAGADPGTVGPKIIDDALKHIQRNHTSLQQAFEDFAFDLMQRRNFTWGNDTVKRDWTKYLDEVKTTSLNSGEVLNGTIRSWAMQFVEVPKQGGYDLRFFTKESDSSFSIFLFTKKNGEWSRKRINAGYNPIANESFEKVVAVALRNTTSGGTYVFSINADAGIESSIMINDNSYYTTSSQVKLTLTCDDIDNIVNENTTEARYANEDRKWSGWEQFSGTKSWTLSEGDGNKTVYYQCKNEQGNISESLDGIKLDSTPPAPNPARIESMLAYKNKITIDSALATDEVELSKTPYRFRVDGQLQFWQSERNFTHSNLSTNARHCYSVQYRDELNNTNNMSAEGCRYTLADSPINISHDNQTTTQQKWRWNSGGHQKEFFANNSDGNSGWISGNSWTQAGLAANTKYDIFVKSRNGDDLETSSITHSAYTSMQIPVGISFRNVENSSMEIKAAGEFTNLGKDLSGTYLESDSGSFDWRPGNEFWKVSNLQPNSQYCFKSKARNGDGDETQFSNKGCKYTLSNDPQAQEFSNVTNNSIQVKWKAGGNPSGTEFLVQSCTSLWSGCVSSKWTTSFEWNFHDLSPNVRKYFRVKARNAEEIETGWIDLGSKSTLANSPSNSLHDDSKQTNESHSWSWSSNGNPSDTEYFAQAGDSNSGWTAEIAWNQNNLKANTKYTLSVKARNKDGINTESITQSAFTSIEEPQGISFGEIWTDSISTKDLGVFSNLNDANSGIMLEQIENLGTSGWKQENIFYTFGNLNANSQYCYKSKARNGDKDETSYSSASCKYTRPTDPIISSPTHQASKWSKNNVIEIDLTAVKDHYHYSWGIGSSNVSEASNRLNADTISVTAVSSGSNWQFHVISHNPEDLKNPSGVINLGPYLIDITRPSIAIHRPREGKYYVDNIEVGNDPLKETRIVGNITIKVNSSDAHSGVNKVELFIDNNSVVNLTANVNDVYSWTWDASSQIKYGLGEHEIKAVSTDNVGNSVDSKIVVVVDVDVPLDEIGQKLNQIPGQILNQTNVPNLSSVNVPGLNQTGIPKISVPKISAPNITISIPQITNIKIPNLLGRFILGGL